MASSSLVILVLHAMGHQRDWFAGIADVELAFPRYAPDHRYLIHNCRHSFPDFAKINFDAVLFTSTFMDLLSSPEGEERAYEEFGWLANSRAVKVALPQDDYWCSEVRDSWYCNIGVHRVYPVCDRQYWPILLPKFLKRGGSAEQGFTTYVTPQLRGLAHKAKPWNLRENDVVYRARQKPVFPNSLGYLKGGIGDNFRRNLGDFPIRTDISVEPSDSIRGEDWWNFVGNSRGIIGSPSGSSLLVRNHAVASCLLRGDDRLTEGHSSNGSPCTKPSDREHNFTALAPRNVEAGMLGTAQILVPGDYSNLMEPGVHYLPLVSDASNARESVKLLLESDQGKRTAAACRAMMMNEESIQIERLLTDVVTFVRAASSGRNSGIHDFDEISRRHSKHLKRASALETPARLARRGGSKIWRLISATRRSTAAGHHKIRAG